MKIIDLEVLRELSDEELAAQGGVAWSNTYKSISLSQSDCISKATIATSKAGLSPQITGDSVYANTGDGNTVVTRCVASKGLVYFFGAGYGDTPSVLVNAVSNNFG